jgi:hypothetical protein
MRLFWITAVLLVALTPEEVTARLNAVRDYAVKLPAANG